MAGDIASYIFGGTSGNPSYEELVRRRQVATANAMRQKKMPTTLGEGMTYLGEAVGDRLESNRLSEAERAFATSEDARLAAARAGAAGGGALPTRAGVVSGGGPTRVPTERIAPAAAPTGAIPGARADIDPRDKIAALMRPDDPAIAPQEVASLDPTQGAAQEPPLDFLAPGSQSENSPYRSAIGGIESSNDYSAVGVPTKYGRAMGRYGVIEANVPKWTAEVLGQPMTPQQFLADTKAQDAVFDHKFGQYVAKYGPEKAARAWYGGEGNINNLNATDAHEKLSVHDYGRDFMNRLRGRRSDAEGDTSTAPVQLAALGGPSGTMTDAPPIGMGNAPVLPLPPSPQPPQHQPEAPWPAAPAPAPNWTPGPNEPMPGRAPSTTSPRSDVENPDQPTVTEDIRPMSVAPNQFAQVGPEMFSPRRMSDAPVAMGPNPVPLPAAPGAPARPPADLPPSLTPVPAASRPIDPGAAPKVPERLDELPGQRAWLDVINNRNSSPYAKSYAENEFNRLEKRRTEINALREADYRDQRELWQKKKEAFDNPSYDIEHLNKRLAAEKTQRDLVVMAPLEERIKAAEGKLKQAEVDAIPDAIAKRKAELDKAHVDYSIAIRTLNKPDTLTHGGTQLERTYDPKTGTSGPYALPPGAPPPEEKAATEPQQKAIQFVLRTRDDLTTLERNNGKAITDKFEAAKSWVPFGANLLHSDAYRKERNAVDNWGAAFMSHVSGAAITPSEAARQLPAFVPAAGDDEKELAEKTRRRRQFTDAVEASGGKVTHEAIMKVLKEAGASVFEKEASKPPVMVRSPEEAAALSPGRRFIGHDGKERQRAVTP